MDYNKSPQSTTSIEKDAIAPKNKYPLKKLVLIVLSVFIVTGTIVTAVMILRQDNFIQHIQSYGYLGLFFVSMIAGSPIPVPTFSILLVITLGSILNPGLVGLIAGLGFAVGRILLYITGRGGYEMLEFTNVSNPLLKTYSKITGAFLRNTRIAKILDLMNRHAGAAIFLAALFPNPFLAPAMVITGARQIAFWKVFLACWAGRTLLFLILAFIGYFGWHYRQ